MIFYSEEFNLILQPKPNFAIHVNNRQTQQAYDTTGTYPISITNAKNQITATDYNLGTGNLISKTDPNGNITSYTYDVFGRITKEIKPYDTSTNPTTSYQYLNDGVAPEGILISKREISGAAGTLDSYTWADGLGRKVQMRTESEDTASQIVSDTFYDSTGEVSKETVPHLDTLSAVYTVPLTSTRNTSFTYDPLARVTIINNPQGGTSLTHLHIFEATRLVKFSLY